MKGEPLGIREVVQDYNSTTFKKVVEDSNSSPAQYLDGAYMASKENVYSNQNLLVVIRSEDLFTFHKKTKDLYFVASSILDPSGSSVGKGNQLVIDNYYVGNFGIKLFKRISCFL